MRFALENKQSDNLDASALMVSGVSGRSYDGFGLRETDKGDKEEADNRWSNKISGEYSHTGEQIGV